MAKKKRGRPQHVPQRTCVGCRQTEAKKNLIRIVRSPSGVQIEQDERLNGRGAYLHKRHSCWERGLKSALSVALKTDLSEDDIQTLRIFMQTMPENEPAGVVD